MNAKLIIQKTLLSLRRDSLSSTLSKARTYLSQRKAEDGFDRARGTDTEGLVPLWRTRVHSSNSRFGTPYQATPEDQLIRALNFLDQDFRSFTFVDLGCGKGRTLLIATKLRFNTLIGIDFAEELVATAQANIAKLGIKNATALHGDAAEYTFPAAPLVVYLYNPFTEDVMRHVVQRLKTRIAQYPTQKLFVVYKLPRCARLFDECPAFHPLGSVPAQADTVVWAAREHAP